jgi:hypothetical protein
VTDRPPERDPLYGLKAYVGWGSTAWLGYLAIAGIALVCAGIIALFVWVAA